MAVCGVGEKLAVTRNASVEPGFAPTRIVLVRDVGVWEAGTECGDACDCAVDE